MAHLIGTDATPSTVVRPFDEPTRSGEHSAPIDERASRRTSPTERIGDLERSCNELWTIEPHVAPSERSRLLRQLDDLERRITSHTLQLVVDPNLDTEIDDSLCRCERRLSALRVAWGLTD